MGIPEMVQQINAAEADEQRTRALRNAFVQVARMNGMAPTTNDLDQAVQFVIDYIKHVPVLMLAFSAAGQQLGAEARIRPLLDQCEQYWRAGIDLIPDHLGLIGLMDDAYYILSILQFVAEQHAQANGQPLMNMQMRPANQTMRNLIGEPHASILDTAVASVIGAPAFDAMMQQLAFLGSPIVDRDPIWGNASVEEIAAARLGAMGIV